MENHFIHLWNVVFFYHMTTLNSKQHIHELIVLSLSFVYVFVCLKLLEYFKICTAVLLCARCLISILEIFSEQGNFNLSTFFVFVKLDGWVVSYWFDKERGIQSPSLHVRFGSFLNFNNINLIEKPFKCLQMQQFNFFYKIILSQRWSFCCSYSNFVFYFGS